MHIKCDARGNLRNFSVERNKGGTQWNGNLERLQLFTGDEYLPEHLAHVTVYSENYGEPRPGMRSAVWLSAWDAGGYSLEIMLREADYEFFREMAARHLGRNIAYVFSFMARDVEWTRLEGLRCKTLLIKDPDPEDIEIAFFSSCEATIPPDTAAT